MLSETWEHVVFLIHLFVYFVNFSMDFIVSVVHGRISRKFFIIKLSIFEKGQFSGILLTLGILLEVKSALCRLSKMIAYQYSCLMVKPMNNQRYFS